MPRPRFTVRRMMIAVAIAGIILAPRLVAARKAEIAKLRADYEAARDVHFDEALTTSDPKHRLLREWHIGLYHKYKQAAFKPWLSVAPDPPRPPGPGAIPTRGLRFLFGSPPDLFFSNMPDPPEPE